MNFNKISVLLLFIGSSILFVGCLPNKYSYKRKGEEVYIQIKHHYEESAKFPINSVMAMESNIKTRGVLPFIAAPYIFNMAVKEISKIVDKNSKKYTAEFSAKNSDDKFYSDNTKKAKINVDEINFIRIIQPKKNRRDTALILTLGLEKSSDGNFIRIVPRGLLVNYSKAKLKIGDKNIDLDINILINGFWLDSEKNHNIQEIASLNITLYNIPFRKEITKEELKKNVTEWFPIVPRSYIDDNIYGTGNYVIRINITEYDEYGERVKISEQFERHRTDITELIKEISKREIKKYEQGR